MKTKTFIIIGMTASLGGIPMAAQKVKLSVGTTREWQVTDSMTQSFRQYKGQLPLPVTKKCEIINDGYLLAFKSIGGAKACSVYNGTVTAVFDYDGLQQVLVRHGRYITAYFNLKTAFVRVGQQIITGQEIGELHTDKTGLVSFHFQIREETRKLKALEWLDKGQEFNNDK